MATTSRQLNGSAVRVIRELTGIRAGAFAKKIEIDPGYLTKIEQGSRQPSVDVMRRIANGLGVPIDAVSHAAIHRAPGEA